MIELVDFSAPGMANRWRVINDGVMGGVSRSALTVRDGRATFAGVVSPDNNGGFASVRTLLGSVDLSGAVAVALRVRGDGQRYQLRVRTNDRFDGTAYKHSFDTIAGEWVNVTLPLAEFESTFRGRLVPTAPALEPARIRQIGLMISDKQFGPFRLDVESVVAVR